MKIIKTKTYSYTQPQKICHFDRLKYDLWTKSIN